MAKLKQLALALLQKSLARIAASYLRRYQPRVVVVAGSVGKTSTTQAIASVLARQFSVRTTRANYNTPHGVALSILGESFPSSKLGWLALVPRMWLRAGAGATRLAHFEFFSSGARHRTRSTAYSAPQKENPNCAQTRSSLRGKLPFDTLVLELGTDYPGELAQYAYLAPELGFVTAVAPEHMEFFGTLEAVAQEELSISQFCQTLLVSSEMIDASYLASYTDGKASDYSHTLALENIRTKLLGKHSRLVLQAAASAARHFGMDASATRKALAAIEPVPGRMRLLAGKRASSIIDDSYNASPDSTVAALDTLAETPASQRIALLGSMNELGDTSAEAHAKVGAHCQPNFLNLLITLGTEANQYLALAARLNGCRVVETSSPYEAAQIILDNLAADAAILAKGSQNGVFAEEAVKQLLANPSDASKLVRQSPYWLARKQRAFADYPD